MLIFFFLFLLCFFLTHSDTLPLCDPFLLRFCFLHLQQVLFRIAISSLSFSVFIAFIALQIITLLWVHPLGISPKDNTSVSLPQQHQLHQQHQHTNSANTTTNNNANEAHRISRAVVEPYNGKLVAGTAEKIANATFVHSREHSPVIPHLYLSSGHIANGLTPGGCDPFDALSPSWHCCSPRDDHYQQ